MMISYFNTKNLKKESPSGRKAIQQEHFLTTTITTTYQNAMRNYYFS